MDQDEKKNLVWLLSWYGIGLSISLNLQAVEIVLDAKIIVDLLKDHNLANNSNATIGISLSISCSRN